MINTCDKTEVRDALIAHKFESRIFYDRKVGRITAETSVDVAGSPKCEFLVETVGQDPKTVGTLDEALTLLFG